MQIAAKAPSILDNPMMWLRSASYEPPVSREEIARVQGEIDSIIGVTRDNKSIAKLVWNGDVEHWKQVYDDWDQYGKPVGGLKRRPWVLYKSIYDDADRFVRDAFVPRFIILSRLEPEQYADTWQFNAHFYEPTRGLKVQYKPLEPPKDFYLFFMTVAEHRAGCCQRAAQDDAHCYGLYAHPGQCLDEMRRARKWIDEMKMPANTPFDSPDAVAARVRDNMTSNYAEQAMNKYNTKARFLLDEAPLVMASNKLIEEGASRTKIRDAVTEAVKRGQDTLEQKLKEKGVI